MAIRTILTAPDPRLKKKSKPVASVDAEVRQLMDDMLETMYAAPGIGLAAPQIGELRRVIVLDIEREDLKTGPIVMANPEVIEASDEDATYEEGCLSVPGYVGEVKRYMQVVARGLNRQGKPVKVKGDALLARAIQHEIDHLDGILFTDRLTSLDTLRKVEPQEQEREAELVGA